MADCPCGSRQEYDECCGPLIAGEPAATPEALMRSRFTAFVRGDFDHIENTHAKEVTDFDRAEAESAADSIKWVSLTVSDTVGGGPDDETGIVEFSARFKQGTQFGIHHERADFRREDGRWVYVDGEIDPKGQPVRVEKVGRNEPCPCGSGKKYKKCCGT